MRAIILAAVLALTGLAPGLAVAQSREQVEQRQAQLLQGWLAETAGWSTGYQALYFEQAEVLGDMIAAAETALEYHANGDVRRGSAWATTWAAETRARLRAPVVAARELDRPPPPLPVEIAQIAPPLVQLREQITGLPSIYIQLFESTETDLGQLVTAIAATAAGDAAAAQSLPAKIVLITVTQMRGEIALAEASIPMARVAGGIQEHLLRSGIANNHAAIAFLTYEQRLLEGAPADAIVTASEIERQAAAMREAADAFEANAVAARANASAMPDSAAALRERMQRAMASTPESASVERRIAQHLDEIARFLRSPRAADVDRLVALWAPIDALILRRIELDAQRRAIIAAG